MVPVEKRGTTECRWWGREDVSEKSVVGTGVRPEFLAGTKRKAGVFWGISNPYCPNPKPFWTPGSSWRAFLRALHSGGAWGVRIPLWKKGVGSSTSSLQKLRAAALVSPILAPKSLHGCGINVTLSKSNTQDNTEKKEHLMNVRAGGALQSSQCLVKPFPSGWGF